MSPVMVSTRDRDFRSIWEMMKTRPRERAGVKIDGTSKSGYKSYTRPRTTRRTLVLRRTMLALTSSSNIWQDDELGWARLRCHAVMPMPVGGQYNKNNSSRVKGLEVIGLTRLYEEWMWRWQILKAIDSTARWVGRHVERCCFSPSTTATR